MTGKVYTKSVNADKNGVGTPTDSGGLKCGGPNICAKLTPGNFNMQTPSYGFCAFNLDLS